MIWVGKYVVALVGAVIGIFIFGIVIGLGGEDRGREAGIGVALFLLFIGWVLVRWIRRGLENAGVSPERVERGVRGMLSVAGLIMIFLGFGGLLYAFSPFDPTPIGWELRLAAIPHAKAFAIASGAYLLIGVLLLARGWGAWRGRDGI